MTPVSPAVVAVLASLVQDRLGLHWPAHDTDLFIEKVAARAADAGFASLLDYYYYLRYDDPAGEELSALAEALVVNESYLFRELEPLEVLVRAVLTPAVAAGRRPRVWSAACASGEEPLTLAMLLADAGLLGRVELVASDLSRRTLARAAKGTYPRRALRRLPPPHLARFLSVDDERVQVAPELVAAVTWRRVNLVDAEAVAAQAPVDVVLCRNVLIYFDDPTSVAVVRALGAALRPGGLLVVGVSESLLRFATPFVCEELGGAFFYRREG